MSSVWAFEKLNADMLTAARTAYDLHISAHCMRFDFPRIAWCTMLFLCVVYVIYLLPVLLVTCCIMQIR